MFNITQPCVHGDGEVMVPAHLNFGKFLLDRIRKASPDDVCICWSETGDELTYGSFVQHAVSVSASLTELGVARGDTVAVAGEPRVSYMPTALAVMLAGAAYTPIELHCGRAVLAHKLNLTRPKYVICTSQFWEAYSDVLRGLEYIKTIISFDDIEDIELSVAKMAARDVDVTIYEPVAVRGDDVALIPYSSGTTGMSKGVLLTHLNCIARTNITWYHDSELLSACFMVGELTCTYLIFLMFYYIFCGKKVIYAEAALDLKALQDHKVNTVPTIPLGAEDILKQSTEAYDISALKVVYCAAGYLQPSVEKRFKERYPHIHLLPLYGASEVDVITVRKPSNSDTTGVGVAVPGCTIKVVDTETRVPLGPNQRGEICVRTPCLMKGYLGADSKPLDEHGFYLTGDVGYYDDRKQFHLVDRLKDIICYEGDKVCPAEVEAILLRHDAVYDTAVVGKPAGAVGELVTAFVVLKPGADATETELVEYVDKEVSWYMRLRGGVRFVSELPRSSRQKVLRRRLKEMLALALVDRDSNI